MTLVTGLAIRLQVLAVDGFSQDTRTGGFSHATRTAKQESMRQLVVANGILERCCYMGLPNYRGEVLRTVLSGGYNKIFHDGSHSFPNTESNAKSKN